MVRFTIHGCIPLVRLQDPTGSWQREIDMNTQHTRVNIQQRFGAFTSRPKAIAKGFRQRASIMLVLAFVSMSVIPLVGCGGASGKSIIRGRVIAGTVGQSVGASPQDIRFDEPGIPKAKVTILTKTGNASRGRGVLTTTTSDVFGDFEIAFAGGQYPRDAVRIKVEGDGIFTSRSISFLPNDGGELLCVVILRPGYEIPVPSEEEMSKAKKHRK